jgi:hypothetical protein
LNAGVASVTRRVWDGGGERYGRMGSRVEREVCRVGREEGARGKRGGCVALVVEGAGWEVERTTRRRRVIIVGVRCSRIEKV